MNKKEITTEYVVYKHTAPNGNAPWARKVINLDTGEIFDCIKDAEKIYGVKVGEVCRGKRKKCGGCRWAYYEATVGGGIA